MQELVPPASPELPGRCRAGQNHSPARLVGRAANGSRMAASTSEGLAMAKALGRGLLPQGKPTCAVPRRQRGGLPSRAGHCRAHRWWAMGWWRVSRRPHLPAAPAAPTDPALPAPKPRQSACCPKLPTQQASLYMWAASTLGVRCCPQKLVGCCGTLPTPSRLLDQHPSPADRHSL